MHYTTLGRTGLKVSRLCLGAMTFGWPTDEATAHTILDSARDHGINFFDTADIYSFWIEGHSGGESETVIGKWLKNQSRRDVVIATKVRGRMWDGPNGEGLSRVHILQAVEDSLRRLQTDTIDLYQVHWPDEETPLEETLSALDSLVQSGKVRYIGASNFPAWLLMKSLWISDVNRLVRFDSLQPHYSLFRRDEFEHEMADLCRDQHIGVIPYSPLAAGFLTGKYTRENRSPDSARKNGPRIQQLINDDRAYAVLDSIRQMAENHNVPVAHVALAWMLAKPVVTAPIIGARTPEQFEQVIGAVDLTLSSEEIEILDKATEGY